MLDEHWKFLDDRRTLAALGGAVLCERCAAYTHDTALALCASCRETLDRWLAEEEESRRADTHEARQAEADRWHGRT
jgi:hypothetical protein